MLCKGGAGAHRNSLHLPLNFAVNLKLLEKLALKKKKEPGSFYSRHLSISLFFPQTKAQIQNRNPLFFLPNLCGKWRKMPRAPCLSPGTCGSVSRAFQSLAGGSPVKTASVPSNAVADDCWGLACSSGGWHGLQARVWAADETPCGEGCRFAFLAVLRPPSFHRRARRSGLDLYQTQLRLQWSICQQVVSVPGSDLCK